MRAMITKKKDVRKMAVITSIAALALGGIQMSAASDGLESSMIWSSYDLGSSGHAEATAIADALQREYETRIRIIPSGTSIGRILPLKTERAKYGFLANEVFFATEGLYEFSDPEWGPQDLRVIIGRPAVNGIAVAADAGVETIEDLRGKRVGYVEGNPSVNVKTDAQLAFGGLTREDVQAVYFGSYGALGPAMEAGQIDARNAVPSSSVAREMEASRRGLIWPEYNPDDTEGWERASALTNFQEPVLESRGAGLDEENPVWLMGYRYPIITTYASTSEDEVYELVKAIDEVYDLFKNATSGSEDWALSKSIKTPADAPWHDGAIRYAKEKGLWTEKDQAWHEARLERLEMLKEAWSDAREEFARAESELEWPDFWEEFRTNIGL